MFAEGLGVAFERNLMMERLQAMRRAADERADRAQPVAEGTVKSHVKHILRKMVAANRTEAVARFHRQRS
jgi:ATP/maltotriose-dependent transcriptional regulator MalT